MLTFDDYQQRSGRTNRGVPKAVPAGAELLYYALSLVGEAGELAEKVKKLYRDDNNALTSERVRGLLLEGGDVLWYLTRIAEQLGHSLEVVAALNTKKLEDRMARGKTGGDGDER